MLSTGLSHGSCRRTSLRGTTPLTPDLLPDTGSGHRILPPSPMFLWEALLGAVQTSQLGGPGPTRQLLEGERGGVGQGLQLWSDPHRTFPTPHPHQRPGRGHRLHSSCLNSQACTSLGRACFFIVKSQLLTNHYLAGILSLLSHHCHKH